MSHFPVQRSRCHSEPFQLYSDEKNRVPVIQVSMKANIHPKWNHAATVICACGSTFTTGSQQDEIHVDICSSCHPFFTGEMRFVDRQGRVDKFMQKMNTAQQLKAAKASKKQAQPKQEEAEAPKQAQPLSYKQVLQNEQNKLKNIAQNKQAATKAA